MTFIQFAAAHGLIIDRLIEGKWVRVKTEDKKTKRNGSYKFLGDVAFLQNHATMDRVAVWRPEGKSEMVDRKELHALMAKNAEQEKKRQAVARSIAEEMVKRAAVAPHPYLASKGFPDERGLVLEDELLIPMREFGSYKQLNSVQRISPDGSKLFLPGGKAKSSVFFIGSRSSKEKWFCEGFVDGLTLRMALSRLYRAALIVVCFSAHNLKHIAKSVGSGYIYADNDESGTGQQAAEESGLPWVMSETVGNDVNDDFLQNGIGYVCKKMRSISRIAA